MMSGASPKPRYSNSYHYTIITINKRDSVYVNDEILLIGTTDDDSIVSDSSPELKYVN